MPQISDFRSQSDLEALPKHERLRAYLLRELDAGRLRPGDALPTELELANSAGMARNTVRQALAGLERSGLISRVRGRGTFVHEAARQRLKSGLDVFALVIPEARGGFYPSLQRGFHDAAAGLHNQVLVCDTDNDPFRQADALLQILDKKVAGVAIVPTVLPATPAHQIRPLHERGVPVVFCHRRVENIQAPLVSFSALEVGRLAARAMLERGHRRVALLGTLRAGLAELYEQGLRETLRAGAGELRPEFVHYDTTHRLAEHEQFLETRLAALMQHPSRPTVIFCGFDSEAELAYLILSRLGIKIPEEVSLVGFGGAWREGAITRRLTSVTVDEEELGRHAVQLLHEMRMRERLLDDGTEILLPLSLSGGETLGLAHRWTAP